MAWSTDWEIFEVMICRRRYWGKGGYQWWYNFWGSGFNVDSIRRRFSGV